MSKEVINVGGEDKVVREDTAKSYRGVVWAFISLGAFIIIAAILLLGGFLKSATDGKPNESPASIENKRQ
ncbi:MAG: hypothetical protein M3Q78_09985 [Acidobacteriota bacterium]|jgi:hypothetical protein|nr:hypothetical protein [Acidobacteriota bacterium]